MSELKLRLQAGATPGADGSALDYIADTSGYLRGFQQTTAGERPTKYSRALAGKPGAGFDGGDWLQGPGQLGASYIGAGTSWSMLAVLRPRAAATAHGDYRDAAVVVDAGGYWGLFVQSTPSLTFYVFDGSGHAATVAFDAFGDLLVVSAKMTGGKVYLSVNGSAYADATTGAPSVLTGAPQIGRNHDSTQYFVGELGELWLNEGLPTDHEDQYQALQRQYSIERPPVYEDIRDRLSRELLAWRSEYGDAEVRVPLHLSLGVAPGSRFSVWHPYLPAPEDAASGPADHELWTGTVLRVGSQAGGSHRTLTLRGLRRYLRSFWYVPAGLTGDPYLGVGIPRLFGGQTWTFERDSPAWVEGQDGTLLELPSNAEAWDRRGQILDGPAENVLTNSSAALGLTDWTTANVTLDSTVRLFDRSVTPQSWKLGYSGGAATLSRVVAKGANRYWCLSFYYQNLAAAGVDWSVVRSSDGKAWDDATAAWVAAPHVNFVADSEDWVRALPKRIDTGSTSAENLTITIRNAAASDAWIGHVQFQASSWHGAVIHTRAVAVTRAADLITLSNDSGARVLNNAHGTVLFGFVPWWTSNKVVSGSTFTVFEVVYSGGNSWRCDYDGTTGALRLVSIAGGVTTTATVVTGVTEGVEVLGAVRWTGASGELGLSPYTLDVFADGVKGTAAVSAALPTEAASSDLTIGSGNSAYLWGRLTRIAFLPVCLTDDEIVGGD